MFLRHIVATLRHVGRMKPSLRPGLPPLMSAEPDAGVGLKDEEEDETQVMTYEVCQTTPLTYSDTAAQIVTD
eukprot:626816-Amphidinium_carterae.1